MPPYRARHLHDEPDWFTNRWPLTPHERNAASRNQPSDSADTPSNSFSNRTSSPSRSSCALLAREHCAPRTHRAHPHAEVGGVALLRVSALLGQRQRPRPVAHSPQGPTRSPVRSRQAAHTATAWGAVSRSPPRRAGASPPTTTPPARAGLAGVDALVSHERHGVGVAVPQASSRPCGRACAPAPK